MMRPKKPQRPKSEVFLDRDDATGRCKRYSAFGGNSPYGKLEAYIKLEQLGEGSYATVYKVSCLLLILTFINDPVTFKD